MDKNYWERNIFTFLQILCIYSRDCFNVSEVFNMITQVYLDYRIMHRILNLLCDYTITNQTFTNLAVYKNRFYEIKW